MDHERKVIKAESLDVPMGTMRRSPPIARFHDGEERKRIPTFPQSECSRSFRRRFFRTLRCRCGTTALAAAAAYPRLARLERIFRLSEDERSAVARHTGLCQSHHAVLCQPAERGRSMQPLRRTHIPVAGSIFARGESG